MGRRVGKGARNLIALAQSNTRPATIWVNEYDARLFEGTAQGLQIGLAERSAGGLEFLDDNTRNDGKARESHHGKIEQCSCCAALGGRYRRGSDGSHDLMLHYERADWRLRPFAIPIALSVSARAWERSASRLTRARRRSLTSMTICWNCSRIF